MKVICSWCWGEGRVGLVGEKAPLEDLRETHGICREHQIAMGAAKGKKSVGQKLDGYDASRELKCANRIMARS